MFELMFDAITLFKFEKELNNYLSDEHKKISTEISNSSVSDTDFIHMCFETYLRKFCASFSCLETYAAMCLESSTSPIPTPPGMYKDILYFPLMTDLIFSSLYTAEYLKTQFSYILVPELLNLKNVDDFEPNTEEVINISSIHNAPFKTTSQLTTEFKIVHPRNNDLDSFERKRLYKIFWGSTYSKYWKKLYTYEKKSEYKNLKYAVPVFQWELNHKLLNSAELGIGSTKININNYLNCLKLAYSNQAHDDKPATCDLRTLLLHYKIERIFHPRLINEISLNLTSLSSESDFIQNIENNKIDLTTKIILASLDTDFSEICNLLPHLRFTNSVSDAKRTMPENIIEMFLSTCFKNISEEDDGFDVTFDNHFEDAISFIHEFSIRVIRLRKDFFATLFFHFKTYDRISDVCSEVIELSKKESFIIPIFLNFRPCFDPCPSKHNPFRESNLTKERKKMIKKSLEEYWSQQ